MITDSVVYRRWRPMRLVMGMAKDYEYKCVAPNHFSSVDLFTFLGPQFSPYTPHCISRME